MDANQLYDRAEIAAETLRRHVGGEGGHILVIMTRYLREQIIPNYQKATWGPAESAIADTAERMGMRLYGQGVLTWLFFKKSWMHACGLEEKP